MVSGVETMVEAANQTARVVAEAGQWVESAVIEMGSHVTDVASGGESSGTQRMVPYSHFSVRPTFSGDLALREIVGVSLVRKLRVLGPDGTEVSSWAAGAVRLELTMAEADLTNRGLAASLLDEVKICRYGRENNRWEVLTTNHPEQNLFVVEFTQAGDYVAAVTSEVVDNVGPEVVMLNVGPNSPLARGGTIEARLADRPECWSSYRIHTDGT